ncbi:MAG: hypothetical protein IMF10_06010 [Proteobacteria bacterium]|nr:hypothetical protein [Pseudomonadota bacterium]
MEGHNKVMRRYFNLLRNLSNWWLYLAVKFGLSGVDPILFRTRKHVLVEVPRRLLQTFKEIFMDECYYSVIIWWGWVWMFPTVPLS